MATNLSKRRPVKAKTTPTTPPPPYSANKTKTQSGNKNNISSKNNKSKSEEMESSLSYSKNVPILFMTGILFFFVLFHLLKAEKNRNERLKQKIDAEIRKKLYYADDYY